MSGFFRVELDGLGNLIGKLGESEERLGRALRALRETGSAGLGTRDLENACHHFQETWHYGFKQIGECAAKSNEGLRKVRQTYQETDRRDARAFGQIGGALGSADVVVERGAGGAGQGGAS